MEAVRQFFGVVERGGPRRNKVKFDVRVAPILILRFIQQPSPPQKGVEAMVQESGE